MSIDKIRIKGQDYNAWATKEQVEESVKDLATEKTAQTINDSVNDILHGNDFTYVKAGLIDSESYQWKFLTDYYHSDSHSNYYIWYRIYREDREVFVVHCATLKQNTAIGEPIYNATKVNDYTYEIGDVTDATISGFVNKNLATEETATSNKEEVLRAIAGIDIDTSDLAKADKLSELSTKCEEIQAAIGYAENEINNL